MTDLMLDQKGKRGRFRRVPAAVWVCFGAGVIFAVLWRSILAGVPDANVQLQIDFSALLTIPAVLKVHIASAISAFVVGAWILARPKGSGAHKTLGWIWVIAMASTALSSFWLTGLNGKSFSWIHGLSAWTVIGLPMGIYAIRTRDIQKHAKSMKGMFFGGMVIAGLFTFLPGRFMWGLFFTI